MSWRSWLLLFSERSAINRKCLSRVIIPSYRFLLQSCLNILIPFTELPLIFGSTARNFLSRTQVSLLAAKCLLFVKRKFANPQKCPNSVKLKWRAAESRLVSKLFFNNATQWYDVNLKTIIVWINWKSVINLPGKMEKLFLINVPCFCNTRC